MFLACVSKCCLNTIGMGLALGSVLFGQPLACFVDLPVYGPTGERLKANVIAAKLRGRHENLLVANQTGHLMSAQGERLFFSPQSLGLTLEVDIELSSAVRVTRTAGLFECRDRASLQHGERDSGADVAVSKVVGRIKGCTIDGDWWVRIVPMFGSPAGALIFDGLIGPDGHFRIVGNLRGERHIVAIGKGSQPLAVVGVNVEVGGKNDIGMVNMGTACPK
jgi:hypothetical protein